MLYLGEGESNIPRWFRYEVKQINSQSDLIWMARLPARLTSQSDPLSRSF